MSVPQVQSTPGVQPSSPERKVKGVTEKVAAPIFQFDDVLNTEELKPVAVRKISEPKVKDPPKNVGKAAPLSGSQNLDTDDNLEQDIEKFKTKLNAFDEKKIQKAKNFYSDLGTLLKNGLDLLKYSDKNEENILWILQQLLPTDHFSETETGVKFANRVLKWVDLAIPLVFNLVKFLQYRLLHALFNDHLEDLKKLYPSEDSQSSSNEFSATRQLYPLQTKMDALNKGLKYITTDLTFRIASKTVKLFSKCLTLSVEHYFDVVHNRANRAGKAVFGLYKGWVGIDIVKKSLDIQQEWKFHLQPQIHVQISEKRTIKSKDETESAEDCEETRAQEESEEDQIPLSPHERNIRYYTVKEFWLAVQNCANLLQVRQMLDKTDNLPVIKRSIQSFDFDSCTTMGEVKGQATTIILHEDADEFLHALEECTRLEDVQRILDERSITTLDLPSTFDRWRSQFNEARFKDQLLQAYYHAVGMRPFCNALEIEDKLEKWKLEHQEKVNQALSTIVMDAVQDCEGKSFDEIKDHFRDLQIDLDKVILPEDLQQALPTPPETDDEWETCKATTEYLQALAEHWVNHQEATARLALQAARQALLSKIHVESKFLNFRWAECNFKIISALIQGFLFFWQHALKAFSSVLELFVTELAKLNIPGLGLVYLFYPLFTGLELKLEALIVLLAEHFFAIKYKPNEYSLDGYKLNMQVRIVQSMIRLQYMFALLQQFALWVEMRLIENCILGLKYTPITADERYKRYDKQYQEAYEIYKKDLDAYEVLLINLKNKDAVLTICPNFREGCKEWSDHDPINDLAKGLKNGTDFTYFPEEVLRSYQDNFGIDLANIDQEGIKLKLEEFFANSEHNLMEAYQDNRFVYLQSGAGG